MMPGPPYRLTCPKCGGHKLVASIASGNTFGGKLWSDSKHDYPMLPQPSFVQHCPVCKHYYLYNVGNPVDTREESFSFDFGNLSFEQTNDAFDELYNEKLEEGYKMQLLFLWLYKYNDKYGGREGENCPERCPESMTERRAAIVDTLLDCQANNVLLCAELYREIGEFDKCIELATPLADGEDFSAEVARKFIEHAKKHDTLVFQLY